MTTGRCDLASFISNPRSARSLDCLESGLFAPENANNYEPLRDSKDEMTLTASFYDSPFAWFKTAKSPLYFNLIDPRTCALPPHLLKKYPPGTKLEITNPLTNVSKIVTVVDTMAPRFNGKEEEERIDLPPILSYMLGGLDAFTKGVMTVSVRPILEKNPDAPRIGFWIKINDGNDYAQSAEELLGKDPATAAIKTRRGKYEAIVARYEPLIEHLQTIAEFIAEADGNIESKAHLGIYDRYYKRDEKFHQQIQLVDIIKGSPEHKQYLEILQKLEKAFPDITVLEFDGGIYHRPFVQQEPVKDTFREEPTEQPAVIVKTEDVPIDRTAARFSGTPQSYRACVVR